MKDDNNAPFISFRDPWLGLGVVVFVGLALVIGVPLIGGNNLWFIATIGSVILWLLVLVTAMVCSRQRWTDPEERRFWTLFTVGYLIWAIGESLAGFMLVDSSTSGGGLIIDGFFLCTYLSWVLALEAQPYIAGRRRATDTASHFGWMSRLLVGSGLFLYLVLLPRLIQPELYVTWINSYILYIVFDLYILLRLSVRAAEDPGNSWRRHWRLLISAFVLLATTDTLVLLSSVGLVEPGYAGPIDLLWHGHFILVLVAVRARPLERIERAPSGLVLPFTQTRGIPLLAYGFAFPILHLVLGLVFDLSGPLARARAWLVLAWLILLGCLNLLQHFRLDRRRRQIEMQRLEAEEQIRYMLRHDPLTGLLNRRELEPFLERAIAAARQHQEGFAVLFADLDGFKELNDSKGHAAGDQALIEAARVIRSSIRDDDAVVRFGGDEFIAVLRGVSRAEAALHTGQRILEDLAAPFQIDDFSIRLPASLGIAMYPDAGESPQELIEAADRAMYQAKSAGGNQCSTAQ